MSSLPVTLSLISLPLFWLLLSRFGNPDSMMRLHKILPRLSIAGSLVLMALLMAVTFAAPAPHDARLLFKLTPLNAVMITLVVFIGGILVRYSRNYMNGETCYPAFFRWMKLTLAAVVLTLLANHLLVFWLGWLCISLSLHRLLVLYPERTRAVLGAHKKFILARLSETLILVAFALLYWTLETAYLDELLAALANAESLPQSSQTSLQVAAVLIAIAAVLKCAQLPFHGWLINIVEAPTPVSALLHAGVINLGGYLLLAFAPLISLFGSAQWVLLIMAGLSTLCAALIMSTRVSVKVRLAWSTSSQMGLMLIECALGLYALALLHLVAHSLYKAFAFLSSSNAVYEQVTANIANLRLPRAYDWCKAASVTALAILACSWLIDWRAPIAPWLLLGLSLASLLATRSEKSPWSSYLIGTAVAFALTAGYVTWKSLVDTHIVNNFPTPVAALSLMDLWVCGLFITLFTISWAMRLWARRPFMQRFRQPLFAGLYLDEWFTRITLKLWPVTLRPQVSSSKPSATVTSIGSK